MTVIVKPVTKQMQADALTRWFASHPPGLKLTEGQRQHILRRAAEARG